MSTPERVREALPLALLFVKAKLWLEADKNAPDDSPSNIFRTPEEAEGFDKKVREHDKHLKKQDEKRRNYLALLEHFDGWDDDEKPRTLNQLLCGGDDEASINVIVSYENIDYLVYTDAKDELAYTVCV